MHRRRVVLVAVILVLGVLAALWWWPDRGVGADDLDGSARAADGSDAAAAGVDPEGEPDAPGDDPTAGAAGIRRILPVLPPPLPVEFFGRVVTPDGVGVAGATVRWTPIGAAKARGLLGSAASFAEPPVVPEWASDSVRDAIASSRMVVTDADGRWTLSDLPPATVDEYDGWGTLLTAFHPDHGLAAVSASYRKSGQRYEHVLQLGGRGRLTGTVTVEATGEPAAGMNVIAWDIHDIRLFSRARGRRTRVAPDGTYAIEDLPAGIWVVLPVRGNPNGWLRHPWMPST